ncbi:hypothetical protein [Adlercreutzia sp. ZJ473]|uniref:hypothetical protein n=1 Tax=Adlercreutzia sp. ZJ473 TaxID=2722822 RepID=UPI0015524AC6|nr:hypothetical protein [Adlercreutzia sp. ZJ473]
MAADRKKVSQYLALTKSFAQNEFVIAPRSKNMQFMLDWGIDFDTAKDTVLGLKTCDYVDGPCADDKHLPDRNDVWVFGKTLRCDGQDVEAYIKVTHSKTAGGFGCLCISFHESERPLVYEFGGEQREVYVLP